MTNNLPAARTNFDIAGVDAKINYATQLATAGLLPREYQNNPGNLLLAVEWADALGVPTMAAITGLHIMNGKPTASVSLMSSLVRRAGHKLRVTCDGNSATAQLIRADDPDFTFEVTWTMDMARTAGLMSNPTWKKYPDAMLKARAITQVCRDGAPDAINGVLYTPEEMGAMVELDENGEQVVIHQVTNVQARPAAAPAAPKRPVAVAVGQVMTDVLNIFGGDKERTGAWWDAKKLTRDTSLVIPIEAADDILAQATAAAAQTTEDAANGIVDAVLVEDLEPAHEQLEQAADDLFGPSGVAA